MSSKQDYLQKYKTPLVDPRLKPKKKHKKAKYSSTTIIDETADWGRNLSDDDVPFVAEVVDFESKFKKQNDSWDTIRQGVSVDEENVSESGDVKRGRKSPSLSPVQSRRSPSP